MKLRSLLEAVTSTDLKKAVLLLQQALIERGGDVKVISQASDRATLEIDIGKLKYRFYLKDSGSSVVDQVVIHGEQGTLSPPIGRITLPVSVIPDIATSSIERDAGMAVIYAASAEHDLRKISTFTGAPRNAYLNALDGSWPIIKRIAPREQAAVMTQKDLQAAAHAALNRDPELAGFMKMCIWYVEGMALYIKKR